LVRIGHLDIADVLVVSLSGFIVISQYTLPAADQCKSVFEAMSAAW
jgi:hypothetical protein